MAPARLTACAFRCRPGVPVPPSLQNIFKEIRDELGHPIPGHGHLTAWADQGVLLLNSVLSVECGRAASHQGKGWETFTDRVIELVNRESEGVVFMLWGSYAQRKGAIIDRQRHCVLTAAHPSPLSAHRGFFGCGHFRRRERVSQVEGQGADRLALALTGAASTQNLGLHRIDRRCPRATFPVSRRAQVLSPTAGRCCRTAAALLLHPPLSRSPIAPAAPAPWRHS